MSGDAPYEPSARRPIADAFRATARGATRFCVRAGVHPDAISYASIAAAAAAAACLLFAHDRPWLLLVVPAFLYLRLWCNMLDGMVAIASGKASRRGEILNELPDRVSDVLIFAGVAHSGLASTALGYWAAILAVLTAYVGMFGQALGARRQFGGLMAKQWRMVVLHVGAWAAWALWPAGGEQWSFAGLTALDWTSIFVCVGCLQTSWVRLVCIVRELQSDG